MEQREVIQILEILQTNSTPIKVLCDDGAIYYVKTCFLKQPPLVDIINEFIGNYIYRTWDIIVPEMCLIKIDNGLILDYLKNNNITSIYSRFDQNLFFIGSKEINGQYYEVDKYLLENYSKNDLKKFKDPSTIIDISTCDIWLGNKDRRLNNPNLLMKDVGSQIDVIAFDHTQLFGNQESYKSLSLAIMDMDKSNMLISSALCKNVCRFVSKEVFDNLNLKYLSCIEKSLDGISNLFVDLPSEIGLSKKGKERIINLLGNASRNEKITSIYKSLL